MGRLPDRGPSRDGLSEQGTRHGPDRSAPRGPGALAGHPVPSVPGRAYAPLCGEQTAGNAGPAAHAVRHSGGSGVPMRAQRTTTTMSQAEGLGR